jgi:hypothetical protein
MTLKFLCPSGHRLKADPRDSGRHVKCPTCGHEVIVPSLEDLVDASDLQEEDSEAFVDVSIEGGDGVVSTTPVPLQPLTRNSPGVPAAETTPHGTGLRSRSLPRLVHVYQPDERRFESLKWLTFVLCLMVAFTVAPTVPYFNPLTAPGWTRGVLFVAVLQACYLAWMLSAPDWSTIRVVMVVFGVTAGTYAAAMTWIALTPPEEPLRLGLEEVRGRALQWCGCVLTLMLFGAYLCARTSSEWRRTVNREMAEQGKPRRIDEEYDMLTRSDDATPNELA